jgi:dihydropteroate synthase
MRPSLRISSRDTLSVTIGGLSPEERAVLERLSVLSDRPDLPGIPGSHPGTVTISGSPALLRRYAERLAGQPGLPGHIPSAILDQLGNYLRTDYTIRFTTGSLDLRKRTHLMGILNVTPDSFSDGGRFLDPARAAEHAQEMAAQGADIIDIGGESTRPGSDPLSEDEELRRVIPVIERLAKDLSVPLSIDTYKATVARKALQAGAGIVNDISGLRFSPDMAKVVADHGAAVVIMHIKGTPRNMQQDPVYEDVIGEVLEYLEEGIAIALRAGVPKDRILVDPGIGFGKTVEHNITLLDRLDALRVLGCPLVLGTSRKRFIGAVLDSPDPGDRIEGTAATVAVGIQRGARILRVHDVAAMAKVARMTDAIMRGTADGKGRTS